MRAPKRAVSALVGVLVIVILVGAAGGAVFFLAPFGGAGTSSTSSSSHYSGVFLGPFGWGQVPDYLPLAVTPGTVTVYIVDVGITAGSATVSVTYVS